MNNSGSQAPCSSSKSTLPDNPVDTVAEAINSTPNPTKRMKLDYPTDQQNPPTNANIVSPSPRVVSIMARVEAQVATLLQNAAKEKDAPVSTSSGIEPQTARLEREKETLTRTLKLLSEEKKNLQDELEQNKKQELETTERVQTPTEKNSMECAELQATIDELQKQFDDLSRKLEAKDAELVLSCEKNDILKTEPFLEFTKPTVDNLNFAGYIKTSPEDEDATQLHELADQILANGEASGDKEKIELVAKIKGDIQKFMETGEVPSQSTSGKKTVPSGTSPSAALPKVEAAAKPGRKRRTRKDLTVDLILKSDSTSSRMKTRSQK